MSNHSVVTKASRATVGRLSCCSTAQIEETRVVTHFGKIAEQETAET
jgi:hypothetical protein